MINKPKSISNFRSKRITTNLQTLNNRVLTLNDNLNI